MHSIRMFNVFLVIAALALSINLALPFGNIVGAAHIAPDDALVPCTFMNGDDKRDIPVEQCCISVQQQLTCEPVTDEAKEYRCFTARHSSRYYLVNQATLGYCEQEGYHASLA